jgi:hypothetical protein
MCSTTRQLLAIAGLAAVVASGTVQAQESAAVAPPTVAPALCFAPDTPDHVVQAAMARAALAHEALSLAPPSPGLKYQLAGRWSFTATQGCCLSQGDPTILTWSIVPDGTPIPGYNGEPSAASTLRSFLDSIYGSQSVWLPIFQSVFDRWSEVAGVTYVYEPSDDGATLGGASGSLGVRGDVRIGGHPIDGNSGILAYNFYPNTGDMVIDTPDSFYTNTGGGSIRLRNVLAHEHGHGLGFAHVCPVNRTKLMEPYLTTSFDGPQLDDILAANRHYGDRLEHADTVGTAATVGTLPTVLGDLSIDDNADVDLFRVTAAANLALAVEVRPVGWTYLQGPQCVAGTSFDALRIHDLSVTVLDQDGSTILAASDNGGLGDPETLAEVELPSGAGDYFVRVDGDSTDSAQMYEIELALVLASAIFEDGFEGQSTGAWSGSWP